MTAVAACRTCGTEPLENARFCHGCGSPVDEADTRAEYKQVTVLFADVVHSMDIASAVGAERLREIMAGLVDRAAAVVRRYGGTLDKFTGDGFMALFGAPVALEDHALRACRAALEIHSAISDVAQDASHRDGIELQLRIGLNSGQVITGEIGTTATGYTAIGEQVGMAQRMESVAPPGAVMLSESTARLVESVAVLGDHETVYIKGRDLPVPARRLLGVSARRSRAGRWESSLVGRRWELGTLASALDQAVNGQGCVLGVTGPAGMGKSRLVDEAAAIAARRGIDVFFSFCQSHTSGIPFHVVTRLLRAAIGLTDLDSAAARAKLRAQVRDTDAPDLLLLEDFLGIADQTVVLPIMDPDIRRHRLTELITAALQARNTAAVYVIEDTHWIDGVSESMLADLIAVIPQAPALVLITYRPEYRGVLARSAGSHTIPLAPLNASQTGMLTAELLGRQPSVIGLTTQVTERAAGNPFFAQEIVRDLAERGVLEGDRGDYVCHANVTDVSVPATLQATIAARIDRLEPGAKRALGAASVIGTRFDPDLLNALGVEPDLDALIAAELIDQVRFTPRAQYAFRHPLIRAVAYESQLKADRADVHRRLADAIQARDRLDEDAALIAEHLEAGGDLRAAYSWHIRAGTWSHNRDTAAAQTNWQRAERVARTAFETDGDVRSAQSLSNALLWQGDPVQAEEILARFNPADLAELQLVQWGLPRFSILFWALGDVERAHQVFALLRERVQHPNLKVLVDAVGSAMAVHENNIAEGLVAAEQVLSNPDAPKQAVEFAAFAAGLAMPFAGRGADFEPIATRCRAERKNSFALIRVMVRYCDVLALTYTGDLDLADERAADYADLSSAGKSLPWGIANVMAGLVAACRGKFPDVITSIEEAGATLETGAAMPWMLPARLLLAKAYAVLARADKAERVLTDAVEHAGRFVAVHDPQVTIVESWVAAGKGLRPNAIELARAAADAAQKSGQHAVEAEALHHAARFGDRTVAERLDALVEHVDGDVVALYARHAVALAASDAPALDAVSAEFEDAGFLLCAADSAAQAATLHHRANRRRKTLDSTARALALAHRCGGAATPAIQSAQPLALTCRPRQIPASRLSFDE
jgi:class 3 adenylate cyclase